MAKYFQVTEKELKALFEVVSSAISTAGGACDEFGAEAKRGERAIKAILTRDLKRKEKSN